MEIMLVVAFREMGTFQLANADNDLNENCTSATNELNYSEEDHILCESFRFLWQSS